MEILTKEELRVRYDEILDKIEQGAVFIYPTDTIYGLGCNALDKKAIERIRTIKERPEAPFSIWAPSLDWIEKNCQITKKDLEILPGPYTLITKLKNKGAIDALVNPNEETIGIRLPDHWFKNIVNNLDIPIITTSVNKSGKLFMTSLNDLDPEIKFKVDFMIDEGEKKARPSKIINLVENKTKER
jgi:tRNA threonylcarbamoyl adenosine modification protein (Sua5/YciO/YrdC/YwlC family)